MLRLLWRRALVFALGVFTVWLIVDVVFRFTDHRLPWMLAIGVTYAIAAYVILPRAIRTGVKVLKRQHVPAYTTTGDGMAGDPVNIGLIGTLAQLRSAFANLGWAEAAPLGIGSSLRMARAFVFNEPYPDAPFSTLFLFGRGQDIGFQKAIGDSPRKRHHVRFWAVSQSRAENMLGTAAFWLNTDRPPDGEPVIWVGAVTRDTGFALTRLTFQITHATDKDTNAERNFLVSELQSKRLIGAVTAYDERQDLPPRPVNRYIFDGDVSIATLT